MSLCASFSFRSALPALLLLALPCPGVLRAEETVLARMLDLHAQSDRDGDGILSPAEQEGALEFVRSRHGEDWAARIERLMEEARAEDGAIPDSRWKRAVQSHVEARASGRNASATEGPAPETVMVPMRDGTRLATDIYLPEGGGPFPVVLTRTPYGRASRGRDTAAVLGKEIAFIAQDMRGRFGSEGENLPFVACGWGELEDGVDTLAWIREQDWSNGKVATVGGSAGGITQNLLAGADPEGLVAQYIAVAEGSLYCATYIGGAFRKADVMNWTTNNRFAPEAIGLARSNSLYGDYWRQFDSGLKRSAKNVPAVHLGGWFDMFLQGTLDEFVERQHHGGPESRGRQKLVIGPWAHALGRMPVGEMTFPDSGRIPQLSSTRWLEHHLLGVENGVEKEPAVTYYVMGAIDTPGAPGNEWRQADDWPVPAEERAFHFRRDGALSVDPPDEGERDHYVEYTFDPDNPVPTLGGHNLTLASGPVKQNEIEARDDVVTFTTAPLEEPLEVTGRIKARIFVSSSAVDGDLSVRLCDVYPDGRSFLIAEGMLRLRHRDSMEKAIPLVPGEVVEVEVDCWSTSLVFHRGHRIRATVTSSNYPRFDVNPGTGETWSEDGAKVKQIKRVHSSRDRPSRLILPVVVVEGADPAI